LDVNVVASAIVVGVEQLRWFYRLKVIHFDIQTFLVGVTAYGFLFLLADSCSRALLLSSLLALADLKDVYAAS